MINQLPSSIDGGGEYLAEKVYVDWPEDNSEVYRFVSSRMEDVESDYHPPVTAEDIRRGVDVTGNKDELRMMNKPPRQMKENQRFEDLSRGRRARNNNSSIPPLDLVSQHSSIEIPGARGAIDIDFRAMSDSMSDGEYDDEDPVQLEKESYVLVNRTTLPEVTHEDLILNPGEYNSSRYTNAVSRRFSDISAPSQYKMIAPIEPNYKKYDSDNDNGRQDEQASFEAVQQRFKQSLAVSAKERNSSVKHEFASANSSKLPKGKPTMLVSPQIKQPLHEKTPNFIELNKVTLNQQKQMTQTSYSNKYADRQRKDSPRRTIRRPSSPKEVSQQTHGYADKVDKNPTLSAHEYWNKRERSVERLTGDHRDLKEDNQEAMQRHIYGQISPKVIYAFTQFGEPLIINASEISIPRHEDHAQFAALHHPFPEHYSQQSSTNHNPNIATSPQIQRSAHQAQEVRRSFDSEHILQDAPFKRQPTLYDERLLEKKTKAVSSERMISHLPPLPASRDSSISQNNQGDSYVANHRRKEINYEQYTLRDFRNIKQINTVGGLGPNIGTESHKQMRDKLVRQKNYAKAVQEKNQELLKKREREHKDHTPSILNTSGSSYMETENHNHNEILVRDFEEEADVMEQSSRQLQNEDGFDKKNSKSSFSSANSRSREQVAKRDVMINYSKSVKDKQLKKQISKSKVVDSQSAMARKDQENQKMSHELFNNSDLDRLLQRHEYDKKMTDQIRQKWEKT